MLLGMMLLTLLTLLIGMLLGQRFTVLVLLPATLLTLIIGVGLGIADSERPGHIGLTILAAIACLQVSYLLGAGIRYLLAPGRERQIHAASTAHSWLARRQPS